MHVVTQVFDFFVKGVGDTLLGVSPRLQCLGQLRVEVLLCIRPVLH
jgi:hypothetical protein